MEENAEELDEEGAGVPPKKRPTYVKIGTEKGRIGLFLGGTPAPSSSNTSPLFSIGSSFFKYLIHGG